MSFKTEEATILITGCDGFLGRHLASQFSALGARVIGIGSQRAPDPGAALPFRRETISLERGALLSLLDGQVPDLCIHAAGPASVPASVEAPLADFSRAVPPALELLEALRELGGRTKFLLLSSAAVYGNPDRLPISEDQPTKPISPYGFHKQMTELAAAEYHSVYGMPVSMVRIFSAYGQGLRKQVVWDLCRRAVSEGELHVFGTGGETRDFIHVDDVVHAVEMIARHAAFAGEVFNVATSEETSIGQLAGWVAEEAGLAQPPVFDGTVCLGAPRNWRADTKRLEDLGWVPRWQAEKGLRQTIQWSLEELRAK